MVNTSFKSQGSWLQVTETLVKLVKAKKKKKVFFFGPDNSGALGSDGWPVGLYPRAPVSSKHSLYLAASPSLCSGLTEVCSP